MLTMILLFLNMGGGEIFIVLIVILLLFGGKGVPSVARTLGKSIREFKDAANGLQRDFQNSAQEIRNEIETSQPGITEEKVQKAKPVEEKPGKAV